MQTVCILELVLTFCTRSYSYYELVLSSIMHIKVGKGRWDPEAD